LTLGTAGGLIVAGVAALLTERQRRQPHYSPGK
jgi:hypothetical protein